MQEGRVRRAAALLWGAVVVVAALGWVVAPDRFGPAALAAALRAHAEIAFLGWAVASVARGLLLLPGTPFVVLGAFLFPDRPFAVGGVSMVGVWVAASIAYAFPDWLGLTHAVEGRFAAQVARLRAAMDRWGLWAVALWAVAPFTPTDVGCAAAGLARMRYRTFLLGLTLGEVPLVAGYVWLGQVAG